MRTRRCTGSARRTAWRRRTRQPHWPWRCWSNAATSWPMHSGFWSTSYKRWIRPTPEPCASSPVCTNSKASGSRRPAVSGGSWPWIPPTASGRKSFSAARSVPALAAGPARSGRSRPERQPPPGSGWEAPRASAQSATETTSSPAAPTLGLQALTVIAAAQTLGVVILVVVPSQAEMWPLSVARWPEDTPLAAMLKTVPTALPSATAVDKALPGVPPQTCTRPHSSARPAAGRRPWLLTGAF
mmetsp:Transcript_15052/g.45051  ORF Transcript_15052/g.45051 Transcript_15052/m.45051 type:complete len:242 (+) Transcript_15052:221-946(+)